MRGAPVLELPTTDKDSGSEKEVTTLHPGTKPSNLVRFGQQTPLPHEVIYTYTEQPVGYEQMSITLFVSSFLMVMAMEEESIRPFML